MTKLIQFTWDGKRRTLGTAKLTTRQIVKAKELIDLAIGTYGCEDTVLTREIDGLVRKCPESIVKKLRQLGLLGPQPRMFPQPFRVLFISTLITART